jgi:ADP-ribosylglycohydrolase
VRPSLLSRFQGALWGAVLGEALGRSSLEKPRLVCQYGSFLQPLQPSSEFEPLLRRSAEDLIAYGRLERGAWDPGMSFLESPTTLLAVSLPVILFFHEQPHRLQQQLTLCLEESSSPEQRQGIAVIAAAIAQILQERTDPEHLIPQVLALTSPPPSLADLLQQVQSLVRQRAGLAEAMTQLGANLSHSSEAGTLALALYCFLSTPEDFEQTLTRAVQTAAQPLLITLIAGALAGTYNGEEGIPPRWRLSCPQAEWVGSALPERLLDAWSGAYPGSSPMRSPLP